MDFESMTLENLWTKMYNCGMSMKESEQIMDTTAVARELGLSRSWVHQLCKSGRLGRRMRGNSGVYVITASELRRFIGLPRRRGRPRKTA